MMIYINGRFLTQPMTGVERYAYSICRALVDLQVVYIIVCPKAEILPCYDTTGMQIVHYGFGKSHVWEQCVLPFFFLGKKDYILFSFTGLGSILIRNKIMTVHDLSFLYNRSWFSKTYYWWYKLMTPLAIKTSRRIITVSQYSKQEILRFFPFIQEDKINVIYGGIDNDRFHIQKVASPAAKHYALAVSSIDPRKNFPMLIKAFRGIKDCQLYIVGKYNHVFSQQEDRNEESENIRFLGRVSDDELLSLYNQAECLIFPSVYEGFGLPLLEAMACGCPVLASDIPVFKEVCGDAAIYFNPYDSKNIHDTIIQYLNSTAQQKEMMREKGFQVIKRFSWSDSAKQIIQLSSLHADRTPCYLVSR